MSNQMPGYAGLNAALDDDSLLVDAAEVHGLVSGFFAAGMALDDKQWLSELATMINDGQPLPRASHELMMQLHGATCQQLVDQDFGFVPLLPEESKGIEERLEALSMWVQGFLAGIALQQIDLDSASEQLQEAVNDLAEIANVGLDVEPDQAEANEEAFTELYEYVRMAVLLAFSEFGNLPAAESGEALH